MVPYRSQRPRLIAFGAAVVCHLASLPVAGWWMSQSGLTRTAFRLGLVVALAGLGLVVALFAAWLYAASRNLPALGSTARVPTLHLPRVWDESQPSDPYEASDVRNLLYMVSLGTLPLFAIWATFGVYESFALVLLLVPAAVCALLHLAACILALKIGFRLEARQAAQWRDVELRAAVPAADASRLR